MKLHYSQTDSNVGVGFVAFYYLMKLHYSQTKEAEKDGKRTFYYLMKLHYSQTRFVWWSRADKFYYLMKLHYSQTFDTYYYSKISFTTLWNYTTLKPQIVKVNRAHYTARGIQKAVFANAN